MSASKKVNLNSVADLRQNTDDNLPSVLTELGYDESFKLIDTKLALGYSTVVIAGLLFLVDKKYDFKQSYGVTVFSVVLYFIISSILYYINYTNKNVKYVGYTEKGKKIVIATWSSKYDPIYNVRVTLDGKNTFTAQLKFNQFFDIVGYFNRDAFKELLLAEIAKTQKKDL
ncbi:signal peptidase complex subunit 2 [Scheffersomyces xylosifermentans]|uniref:signal peptidase complex subunit 2 n=1 Tax=Scheffersomyces xylosifermentans TaxID=1304137 RepID=UPI00315DC358